MTLIMEPWKVEIIERYDQSIADDLTVFFNRAFPSTYPTDSGGRFLLNFLFCDIDSDSRLKSLLAVARLDSGEIIGTMSAKWKRILLGDEFATCYEMGNTFTDPRYRKSGKCSVELENEYLNKSVFGRLFYEIEQHFPDNFDFCYGLPNEEALKAWIKHAGFEKLQDLKTRSIVLYSPFISLENLRRRRNRIREIEIDSLSITSLGSFRQYYTNSGSELKLEYLHNRFFKYTNKEYKVFFIDEGLDSLILIGRERSIGRRRVLFICEIYTSTQVEFPSLLRYLGKELQFVDRIVFMSCLSRAKLAFYASVPFKTSDLHVVVKIKSEVNKKLVLNYFNSLDYGKTDLV